MIDLHTHSTASDGSLTPAEIVALSASAGITWLALTDHNTVGGLEEFLRAAEATSIRPVPGVEFSTDHGSQELHILALDLPRRYFGQVHDLMEDVAQKKEASNRDLAENLTRAGYPISYDEIRRAHPDSFLNRAHMAAALVERGHAQSVRDAFSRFLRPELGYYHPPKRLAAAEVVGLIRDWGAVPVWAHPLFNLDAAGVTEVLGALVPAGLSAMETCYSTYSPAQTRQAMALADAFKLKYSGGSDFHGRSKPDIRLGVGRGDLAIPESVALRLLEQR